MLGCLSVPRVLPCLISCSIVSLPIRSIYTINDTENKDNLVIDHFSSRDASLE